MDKTIKEGTKSLYYKDEGKGFPIVLLHGFAEDGAVWDNQAAALQKNYRLIIPDLPGSGRSTAHPGPLSMGSMAEDIRVLLDHEDIQQTILIGHSMGGYIALAFAHKYPQRLKGFGLFHSSAYPDSEEKKAARRKGIEFIQKNGAAPFIKQSTPNLYAETTREQQPALIAQTLERYSSFSPQSLIQYYEAMILRPDRTDVLKTFPGPVLFVIGRNDKAVDPQHALQQSHLPGLSHVHVLERSAHMGMQEEPERSNHILQSFLNFTTEL